MNLTVIEEPPVEPVTALEAYQHLRLANPNDDEIDIQDDADYAMVLAQIKSAREHCEAITRRSFVLQTLRLSTDAFPPYGSHGQFSTLYRGRLNHYGYHHRDHSITLFRPPFVQVVSVSYYDGDNILQEIDPFDYYVTDDQLPKLHFVEGFPTPSHYHRPDAIRVEYSTGYPTTGSPIDDWTSAIPESIRRAILLDVQLQYDELDPDKRTALSMARDALLVPYVVYGV